MYETLSNISHADLKESQMDKKDWIAKQNTIFEKT